MSYEPIANVVPQYDNLGVPASGYVLKAYKAGTTTNISMATDTTGTSTHSDIVLNTKGYPEVSGTIITPHIDQQYDLALYPTQAAADADTGAVWTIYNLSPIITRRRSFKQYTTDIASDASTPDEYVSTWYDNNDVIGSGATWVFTGTTTAGLAGTGLHTDGYVYNGNGDQYRIEWINALALGCLGDGTTDDSAAAQIVLTLSNTLKKPAYFSSGKYNLNTTQLDISSLDYIDIIGDGFASGHNGTPNTVFYCNALTDYVFSDFNGIGKSFQLKDLYFDGTNGGTHLVDNAAAWRGILTVGGSANFIRVTGVSASGSDTTYPMLDLAEAFDYVFRDCEFNAWPEGKFLELGGTTGTPTHTFDNCTFRSAREIMTLEGNALDIQFIACMFEASVVIMSGHAVAGTVAFIGGHAEDIGNDQSGNSYTTGLSDRGAPYADIAGKCSAAFTMRYGNYTFHNFTFSSRHSNTGYWFDGIGRGNTGGAGGSLRLIDCAHNDTAQDGLFVADSDSPTSKALFQYIIETGTSINYNILEYADARLVDKGSAIIEFSDASLKALDIKNRKFIFDALAYANYGFTTPPTIYPNGGQWEVGDIVELADDSIAAGKESSWIRTVQGTADPNWMVKDFIPYSVSDDVAAAGTMDFSGVFINANSQGSGHVWRVTAHDSSGVKQYDARVHLRRHGTHASRSIDVYEDSGAAAATVTLQVDADAYTLRVTNNSGSTYSFYATLVEVYRTNPQ